MAKTSRKKRNEPISINTVYEKIKDPKFVQQLWLEVIADIGDKPTYKHIKEMVGCILNGTLSDYETDPVDHTELLRRRSVFTEISIMAYTVDRVISEFLYRKLQTEFKSLVGNILEEFQIEKKPKEEASSSKINSMFENIESIFTTRDQNNFDKGSGSIQQAEASQRPVRKRGRPRKSPTPSTPSSTESSLNKLMETTDEIENFKAKDSDQESNLTFNSLSSVHTTDLSSFDDSVSICTDDGKNGRRKKQVPLKKANSMILEGKLSDVYKVEMSVEVSKRKREV